MSEHVKEWETNLTEVMSLFLGFFQKNLSDRIHIIPSRCKYVSLRFDMRDGAFIILDRDGKRIEFQELKKELETKYE